MLSTCIRLPTFILFTDSTFTLLFTKIIKIIKINIYASSKHIILYLFVSWMSVISNSII